jgi:hypothetical protein
MKLWYGLKVDGELEEVKRFEYEPDVMDFGKVAQHGVRYEIVMVRVREITQNRR